MKSLDILNVSNNKLECLPQSITNCSNLSVIDASNNQLKSFPGDLALKLPRLQSFLVEGNRHENASNPVQTRPWKASKQSRTKRRKK
eukprot:scaffold420_cov184-Alexandrium_tamarense.AAC.13